MKKIIFIFLIVHCTLIIDNCSAQWDSCLYTGGIGTYGYDTIGTSIYCAVFGPGGIYRSTNNGLNWVSLSNGFNYVTFDITHNNNYIFAAAYHQQVCRTSNNGVNWMLVNSGLPTDLNYGTHAIIEKDNIIFVGFIETGGVYSSTNNGDNWIRTDSTLNSGVLKFESFGSYLFAGTYSGLYRTSNDGISWQNVNAGVINSSIWSISNNGTNIYAAGGGSGTGGAYVSTNFGDNWKLILTGISVIYNYNNYIFASNGGNFLVSTNNGINWINRSDGLGSSILSIFAINGFCYAGGLNNNPYSPANLLWRRPLSELITGINTTNEITPKEYILFQNYPNPFNPTTNIRYEIPKSGFVKLVVFDILGREVQALVNEKQNAGTYEVTFNGTNLSSGVYFYKLQAGNYPETKRMLLIK